MNTFQKRFVENIKADVNYYGTIYHVDFAPKKQVELHEIRYSDDGAWFGVELGEEKIPVNLNIGFSGVWYAHGESCEQREDGTWEHHLDENITCENIKVTYTPVKHSKYIIHFATKDGCWSKVLTWGQHNGTYMQRCINVFRGMFTIKGKGRISHDFKLTGFYDPYKRTFSKLKVVDETTGHKGYNITIEEI